MYIFNLETCIKLASSPHPQSSRAKRNDEKIAMNSDSHGSLFVTATSHTLGNEMKKKTNLYYLIFHENTNKIILRFRNEPCN